MTLMTALLVLPWPELVLNYTVSQRVDEVIFGEQAPLPLA